MSKNTGCPAFPLPVGDQECCGRFESGYGGMSLRDYFAAKAMHAVYRDFWNDVRAGRGGGVPEDWEAGIANGAYRMADAMLKERSK